MLYFSKIRVISVVLLSLIISYFAFSNFFKFDDNFLEKKINLGLDLQGGSYLLLEVDNKPVINQKLQAKLVEIKKILKKENIIYKNFALKNNVITFETEENFINKIENLFIDEKSEINPYFPKFKSHELDLTTNDKIINIKYSDYGLILLKNSSLDQAIEIVRRRVDELGTNEPTIVKRGNERILVERGQKEIK